MELLFYFPVSYIKERRCIWATLCGIIDGTHQTEKTILQDFKMFILSKHLADGLKRANQVYIFSI